MEREYYSERFNGTGISTINKNTLGRLFGIKYNKFKDKGYFQLSFGYVCEDIGYVNGVANMNLDEKLFEHFLERKDQLWPITNTSTIHDVFDMIEFFYDHIAKPSKTKYHDWNNCGLHVYVASQELGRKEWIEIWNPLLERLDPPFYLTSDGNIQHISTNKELIDNPNLYNDNNIDDSIKQAKQEFFGHNSDIDKKHTAIRKLADIIEPLRIKMETKINKKDTNDLFNIFNNYHIRHNNEKQKSGYDKETFYPCIFYMELAMLDLLARLKL